MRYFKALLLTLSFDLNDSFLLAVNVLNKISYDCK